jgi:hypothetical protein
MSYVGGSVTNVNHYSDGSDRQSYYQPLPLKLMFY